MSDEPNSAPTAGEEALMAPPPKPTGYRVTVSGVLDNADIAEVTGALHVHGYSQGNFDALLLAKQAADRGGARHVTPSGHINGGRESIAEAIKRNEKALRARWGESHAAKAAFAMSEANRLMGSSALLEKWFQESPMGTNVPLLNTLAARGEYRARKRK